MQDEAIFYAGSIPDSAKFPCFLLTRSSWDDYGYKTSFHLYEVIGPSDKIPIGALKIAEVGQKGGRTQLPSSFNKLGPTFFSLGQSNSFYTYLKKRGTKVEYLALSALNDVTRNQKLLDSVKDEQAFVNSLTRFLGPLGIAKLKENVSSLEIGFTSRLPTSKLSIECIFNFDLNGKIPGTINSLIGKNGAGKTQLLANFVANILGLGEENAKITGREFVKKVIVVSYSVFDQFFLPDQIKIPGRNNRKDYVSEDLKYVYIGLRERISENNGTMKIAGSLAFSRRFTAAIKKISDRGIYQQWKKTIEPILREADFSDEDVLNEQAARAKFRRLGAGHKSTLSILTSLFSEIEPGSLIVIDEPENHLHPSLLSATLHILRQMLADNQSVAVISTHSPIVVQEVPAKYVRVLRKFDGHARVDKLKVESFGASIDSLTSEVFGVPVGMPSYVSVLKTLAEKQYSIEAIEDELGGRLSAEARSFYLSMLNS
ncbi:ATP-binding protein [Chromobacterium haemolyticum]|uniref:ATP-binding protein n=1 Tax=Chromobacterium fluminis TaxID=3044269 RepID=A0ABX0LNA1_9NEIS|nr:AAA family ATPase [Chromobacterium haemolyticum]NHR08582.1 ATP-binding protein [Chromobacterium haemolyticum]